MSRFSVPLKDSLETTLERVKTTIISKGGTFAGDTLTGQFSGNTSVGMVKGRYTVNDGAIDIVITDKPFIAPMAIIEDRIRNYFA